MIDDKGRLFGKLSVIDIFIVAAVAAVVAVGVFKFGSTAYSGRGPEETIRLKFYAEALEDFTVDAIAVGDRVMNDANDNYLGHVVALESGESVGFGEKADGTIVASPMEGYSSLEITTELTGHMEEGSAVINGNLYSTGSEIIIRAGKGKVQLKISGVSAVR